MKTANIAWSFHPGLDHAGALVPEEAIKLPIWTHALHYGGSVIEGIICTNGPRGRFIFRLHDHLERLFESAANYGMPNPEFSMEMLVKACADVLTYNPDHTYLRPIVFRGSSDLGVNPAKAPICCAVISRRFDSYLSAGRFNDGVIVGVSNWRRPEPDQMPIGKGTALYITGQLMKIAAHKAGQAEQLIFDFVGRGIAEASGQNLFVVIDGYLQTPGLNSGCLEGITRDTVIRLASILPHQEVTEHDLSEGELIHVQEAFLTGTLSGIVPVTKLVIGNLEHEVGFDNPGHAGPITRKLQELYRQVLIGELEIERDWLTPVPSNVPTI